MIRSPSTVTRARARKERAHIGRGVDAAQLSAVSTVTGASQQGASQPQSSSLPPVPRARLTQGATDMRGALQNARMLQLDELVASKAKGKASAADEARFDALAVQRGERAFRHALERTREWAAQGLEVIWGFDLDNTLYDTRARTLAIGEDFDAAHGTHYFAGITTDDMARIGRDGRATAKQLGMSAAHAEAFAALWDREFWNPARVAHDVEIPEVLARARAVLEAGGTLRYVTGRAESWLDEKTGKQMSFRADSLDRLKKSGLPAEDAMLVLKPKPGQDTPTFKRDVLAELDARDGTVVAGFVTDTLHELIAMRHVDTIPCFWVRTSFELARHSASPPWVYAMPQVM